MANLEQHMREQDALTAAYEAVAETREFAFDVKLIAFVRVAARNEAQARKMLRDALDGASANFGAWPNGDPVLGSATIDGSADLIEVDGEEV